MKLEYIFNVTILYITIYIYIKELNLSKGWDALFRENLMEETWKTS